MHFKPQPGQNLCRCRSEMQSGHIGTKRGIKCDARYDRRPLAGAPQ